MPGVKGVDVSNGIILMDWIEGHGSVREVLGGLPEEGEVEDEHEETETPQERLDRLQLNEGASSPAAILYLCLSKLTKFCSLFLQT